MRAALPDDHRAVGQNIEARPPERLFSVSQTLAMQNLVHRVSAKAGAIGKGGEERLRRLVPAFETWAVAGGERGRLAPWSFEGYGAPLKIDAGTEAHVLTPRSTVAALAAGYRPEWSAARPA